MLLCRCVCIFDIHKMLCLSFIPVVVIICFSFHECDIVFKIQTGVLFSNNNDYSCGKQTTQFVLYDNYKNPISKIVLLPIVYLY